MGFLTYRRGDLFFSPADGIGHGVNTRGFMGSGTARELRTRFPAMYEEYRDACLDGRLLPGETLPWQDPSSGLWVYNLAIQDNPGPHARLEWAEASIREMVQHAEDQKLKSLAMPQIGTRVGGLKWHEVEQVLSREAANTRSLKLEVWIP